MDLAGRLAQLEQIVRDAKSMPLSSSVLISRDEVLEMLHEMQESLPEEIKQARWVVKDREELLAKARAEGDRIIEQAREDQRRMAMKDAVAKRAQEESARMLQEAGDTTADMRREAEDYVDAKLAQFEIALRKILEDAQGTARSLAKTLDQVEVGRDRLRSPTTVAEQEFGPADVQPEPSDLFDGEAGDEGFAGGEGVR
jgi:F0F1-type ATP synthase membrane subunit b/b'